jgi:hypothetical protein
MQQEEIEGFIMQQEIEGFIMQQNATKSDLWQDRGIS